MKSTIYFSLVILCFITSCTSNKSREAKPLLVEKLSHGIRELLIKKEGDKLDTLFQFEYDTARHGVLFWTNPKLSCIGFDFHSSKQSPSFGLGYVSTGSPADIRSGVSCSSTDGINFIYSNYTRGSSKAALGSNATYVYANKTSALVAENFTTESRYHMFESCFKTQLKKVNSLSSEMYLETSITDRGVTKITKHTLQLGLFD